MRGRQLCFRSNYSTVTLYQNNSVGVSILPALQASCRQSVCACLCMHTCALAFVCCVRECASMHTEQLRSRCRKTSMLHTFACTAMVPCNVTTTPPLFPLSPPASPYTFWLSDVAIHGACAVNVLGRGCRPADKERGHHHWLVSWRWAAGHGSH